MALHTEAVLGFVVYWGAKGKKQQERQCATQAEAEALAARHNGDAFRIVATLRNGELQDSREVALADDDAARAAGGAP